MVDVAVEQQGIASAELAEPPLPRLAPPRVFDPGVHVGVKAIPGVTSELEEVWAAGQGPCCTNSIKVPPVDSG